MAEEKKLTLLPLSLIALNSALDSGIFMLPVIGAAYAGNSSLIAWLLLTIIFIYIAMCFGELSSRYPKSGGVYEFSKQAYGRVVSFVVGWMGWLVANMGIAMLVVSANMYAFPGSGILSFWARFIASVAIIILFNYVAYRGINTGKYLLFVFGIASVTTIVSLIIPNLIAIDLSNFQPWFIYASPLKNIGAMFLAVFFISELFFGIEGITYLSEECENPQKNIPIAIILSILGVSGLAILLAFSSLGFVNWSLLSTFETPMTTLAMMHYGSIGYALSVFMLYLAIMGSAFGWIVEAPYLLYAMSRDRLFLPQFAEKHKKYNSPYKAIIFQTCAIVLFIAIGLSGGGYSTFIEMIVPISIVMYCIILIGLPLIRKKNPGLMPHFTVPFGNVGPIIVSFILLSFIGTWYYLEPSAPILLMLGFFIMLLGFPVYFLMSLYYDPKMITGVHDLLSYATMFFEGIIMPKKVRKQLLNLLGNIRSKNILEYGCSVGTLTIGLAAEVGPEGRIYATDISKNNIKLATRRISYLGHKHVSFFHDPDHHKRVHADVPRIDAIVSTGIIGYVQDVKRVLREFNQRMQIGGKIAIMDYDKFFRFIPNIDWLTHDEMIRGYFEDCGFRVYIARKRGFLWEYIFIHGEKIKDVYHYKYI